MSDNNLQNIDYVICELCGRRSKRLSASHLRQIHQTTLKDYRQRFPNAITVSKKSFELKSFKSSTVPKKKYKPWSEEALYKHKVRMHEVFQGSKWKSGVKRGVETRKKLYPNLSKDNSKILRAYWKSPQGKDRQKELAQSTRGIKRPEVSKKLKEFYQTDIGKQITARLANKRRGIPRSSETLAKIKASKAINGYRAPQNVKDAVSKAQTGRKHSPEEIAKRKESLKRSMQSQKYWDALQKGLKLRPNKFEQKIAAFLPSDFQYTGDFNPSGMFKFQDGRNKNADFTLFPSRTAVIECFGTYWHGKHFEDLEPADHEADIVNNYSAIGVTCLVIWEHELKDMLHLKNKISQFVNYVSKENITC